MSAPAWAEIPLYSAGTFALLHWYVPELAAAATELSALTPLLVVTLAAGVLMLRDVVPEVVG